MPTADRRMMMKMSLAGSGAILAAPAFPLAPAAVAAASDFDHLTVRHRTVRLDDIELFYREAGRRDAPAVLLLHGFPTSSHMFRHLIPALADRYRVVAPDYPGFGYSGFPSRDQFQYSFANLARVVADFTDAVGLSRYAIYIQDYGAPVGLRLALERPAAIRAIITQNGNAYEEGLSPLWVPIKTYWADPSNKNREALRGWLNVAGVRLQYLAGVSEEQAERLAPDSWTLDWERLQRPGNIDVQLDLFRDYQTNVELYPRFQQFFRDLKPPMLVLWGRNDPFFTTDGARAFQRDVPNAKIELVDASHFLLETHGPFAAHHIRNFLDTAIG